MHLKDYVHRAIKTKTILSANTIIPVNIESLLKNKSLNANVTREEFENVNQQVFSRVLYPVQAALAKANLTEKDIDAIELIGGGIRVPKIKKVLSSFFSKIELGHHLNGDESSAFGAAFIAANLSTSYRVREINLIDYFDMNVFVKFKELGISQVK